MSDETSLNANTPAQMPFQLLNCCRHDDSEKDFRHTDALASTAHLAAIHADQRIHLGDCISLNDNY